MCIVTHIWISFTFNIFKDTTDPGIECFNLIEWFDFVNNLCLNFSFVITKSLFAKMKNFVTGRELLHRQLMSKLDPYVSFFNKQSLFCSTAEAETSWNLQILVKLQFGLVWRRARNSGLHVYNNLTNMCHNLTSI